MTRPSLVIVIAWWKWLLIGLAVYAVYVVWLLWPILWAITSSDPIMRMKRIRAVASRCYERGRSKRANELAQWGLWFAGEPEEAKTPEARRLGSDIAAASSLAYGRLNMFPFAEMMAHNSVLRDATNPFAYEVLGLARAMHGETDDARACFMQGLGFARESQPVDTEAEERINRQLVWLSEHASTINQIYERWNAKLPD
jgi:hypothetical protein